MLYSIPSGQSQSYLTRLIVIDPMVSNKASTTGTSTSSSNTSNTSHILLPSLKFLWEIYRAILDILRSNSKLEHVYHITAQSALKFCHTYHRKMEFRHLCDMLRTHLGNLRQFGSTITTSSNADEDGKSSHKVHYIWSFCGFFSLRFFSPRLTCLLIFAYHWNVEKIGTWLGRLDGRIDWIVPTNTICSIGNR